MADPTMIWGQFGNLLLHRLQTISIEGDKRDVAWRLAPMPLIGKHMRWQNMGMGPDNVRLDGLITRWAPIGQLKTILDLRALADTRTPQPLITKPKGEVLGRFFVESIADEREELVGGSSAMFVTVSINFVRQGAQ